MKELIEDPKLFNNNTEYLKRFFNYNIEMPELTQKELVLRKQCQIWWINYTKGQLEIEGKRKPLFENPKSKVFEGCTEERRQFIENQIIKILIEHDKEIIT